MKIRVTIAAQRGAGGPMETAIALAKIASDDDLEKLEALGRCLSAAAKAEREKRKPAETKKPRPRKVSKFSERFPASAHRRRHTPTREMI